MGTLTLHLPTGTSPEGVRYLPYDIRRRLGEAVDSTSPVGVAAVSQKQHHRGWYAEWETRLDTIRELYASRTECDWPPPTPLAGSKAAEFLEKLHEADEPPSNISQSAIGGIAFTFLRGETEVFVEILNNGNIYAAASKPEDLDGDFPAYQIDQGDFGYDSLIQIISTAADA